MRGALAVAGKDLRDVVREKSILVALLVQFLIAGFSAFLAAGLLGLYDPDSAQAHPEAAVAYVGPLGPDGHSFGGGLAAPGGFDGYLEGAGNLRVVRPGSLDPALAAFAAGDVDAVVEERIAGLEGVRTLTILLPEADIRGTLLTTQLKGLLQDYESDLRQARQERLEAPLLEVGDVPGGPAVPYGFVLGTLLPLLVLTPVFLSGAIAGDAVVQEVQARTLLLLRSAPAGLPTLLLGKLLVPVLLAPAQAALWMGLLRLNGITLHGVPTLLLLATALALLLSSLSVLLAAAVRREGAVQAAYAVLVLALAVGSLLLPRDPLNLIALLGSGGADAPALLTLALLLAASAAGAAVALPVAARRLRGMA